MNNLIRLLPLPEELNDLDSIPQILAEWEKVKIDLTELYQIRDQVNTLTGMKKGIGLFIQFLFWSNDIPVRLNNLLPWNELVFKPVNLDERLSFIISRPKLFHSFRQLSELMIEQEKLYAKKSIVKKASKPNNNG